MSLSRRTWSRWLGGLGLLGLVGCATPPQPFAVDIPLTPPPAISSPGAPPLRLVSANGPALSLDGLLELAEERNPELAAARARVAAAQGQMVQAGLYPNPTITWEAGDLNDPSNGAGTQGPIFAQRVVTAGKLRLARQAASHGVASADWQAVTRWYDVATRVRLAWFEALTAREEVKAAEEIVRLADEALAAAKKLEAAGAGTRPDVIRAEVERDESRTRLETARQRQIASRRRLAAAVGVAELPDDPLHGSLEAAVPVYRYDPTLTAVLSGSSEVQAAQADVMQTERLLARARAERVPDVTLTARPYYDFTTERWQAEAQVGAALPLFNRNQGNIQTAEADLARVREEARQVELRLTERLATAFERYLAAGQQAEAYARRILPNARESLRLVRLGYERGDPKYDFTALLQAQQTLAQARLAQVRALGELWRAASEIAGLLQRDPH